MEKLLAMNVAAALTNAVISNLEDNLTIDVDIKDSNLRAENLMTWELFRIFYHATKSAAEDEQNWPSPKVTFTNFIDSIKDAVIPLLAGSGSPSPVLQQILDTFANSPGKS